MSEKSTTSGEDKPHPSHADLIRDAREQVEGIDPTDGTQSLRDAATAKRKADDKHDPTRVGPYKILEVLGEGGMGTVYLAEQEKPVRRRVALKLIKAGMDTKQVVARFEAEQQALALMNHPGIAKVFDVGATEQGRPYFTMEHVPGLRITDYCDKQRLTTKERLELFMQVCEAVQHAHQKAVIHRDIKPSNILVTIQDGKPVPKIIDFGVAKATQQQLTERTLFTEQGQLVGTPEYMSPEQAEMTALDIDTRTDIYSLGVVLYELLAGTLPFEPTTLKRAGFAEIQRIIREQEPPKPSTKLSSLGDESTNIARRRHTDHTSLAKQLRGDLDWITLKAMEKDRTRRYVSAAALAEDIIRHVKSEPVLASPPSTGYRLKKLVQRNRGLVAAILAVIMSLTVGLVASLSFYLQADQERLNAKNAAEQSEHDALKAREVTQFLQEMLSAIDPANAQGHEVTLREVLEKASKRMDDEFQDQPEVAEAICIAIARTFDNLGLPERAVPHIKRIVRYREQILGANHPRTLDMLLWLANAQYLSMEATAESLALYRKLYDRARSALGREHRTTIQAMAYYGNALRSRGRYVEAEPLILDAFELSKQHLGDSDPQTAYIMTSKAWLLRARGDIAGANDLYVGALEIMRKTRGSYDVWTLRMGNELASGWQAEGKLDEAEKLFRESLATCRRVLGPRHRETLFATRGLADLCLSTNRVAEAGALAENALEASRLIRSNKKQIRWSLELASKVQEDAGDYSQAVELQRELLAIENEELGETSVEVLGSLEHLVVLAMRTNDVDAATHFANAYLNGWRRRSELASATATDFNGYAWALVTVQPHHLRQPAMAAVIAERAVQAAQNKNERAACLDTLARAHRLSGDLEQAVRVQTTAVEEISLSGVAGLTQLEGTLLDYLIEDGQWREVEKRQRTILIRSQALARNGLGRCAAAHSLALTLRHLGRFPEAESLVRKTLEERRTQAGDEDQCVQGLALLVAYLVDDQGRQIEAEGLYRSLLKRQRERTPPDDRSVAATLMYLAMNLNSQARYSEAEVLLLECLDVRERAQVENWLLWNTKSVLGETLIGQGRFAEAEALLCETYLNLQSEDEEIPVIFRRDVTHKAWQRVVLLYDTWENAKPNAGYAKKAAEWRARSGSAKQPHSAVAP